LPSILTNETDPRVRELRSRLDAFYASTSEYRAFKKVNSKPEYWEPVNERVRDVLARKSSCSILEFGAGVTGYRASLGEDQARVRFVAQDVTDQNQAQLAELSDEVFIGDVSDISESFDVIFSTFVFEHVTTPKATLQHLLAMLQPGGSLFIACPRYGIPFYTPPSARHYGFIQRLGISLQLARHRIISFLTGKPAFLIHIDPSVFHGPWYRDSDAVHWPSYGDLKRSLPSGYRLGRVRNTAVGGLKGWIYRHFLLLSVEIRRGEQGS